MFQDYLSYLGIMIDRLILSDPPIHVNYVTWWSHLESFVLNRSLEWYALVIVAGLIVTLLRFNPLYMIFMMSGVVAEMGLLGKNVPAIVCIRLATASIVTWALLGVVRDVFNTVKYVTSWFWRCVPRAREETSEQHDTHTDTEDKPDRYPRSDKEINLDNISQKLHNLETIVSHQAQMMTILLQMMVSRTHSQNAIPDDVQ